MINRINEKKIINVNAIKDPQTGKIIVQSPFPPTTCLAIESGGSRCLVYVGAYRVAYKKIVEEVIHVSGSSGGSICALAIALGYDPDEAEEAMLDLNLERFLEGSQAALTASSLIAKAKTLLSVLMSENYSLSSGNEFLEWLRDKVGKKMGNRHATFEDLVKKIEAEGNRKFKYLYITGTNISLVPLPESKILSHETYPKMELALAAFISSCLPGAFPPVKYDGHLWFDGGIMNSLPTKLFDDRRFLPPGYDFNDQGLNPCVLAWKVDTKDEISQVLYGIIKKIDLRSASEVVTALHNGLTQNSNIDEIREGRLALALSDNDIGLLESINIRRKKCLIANATKESLEFYENYYNAVYAAKGYKDTLAWLDSLSLEEILAVMGIYEGMLDKIREKDKSVILISNGESDHDPLSLTLSPNEEHWGRGVSSDNVSDVEQKIPDNKLIDPDPVSVADQATEKMLDEYLVFLEKYLQYRMKLILKPECKFDVSIPDFHINIPPAFGSNEWNEKIESGMKEKLKQINLRMRNINEKLECMALEFKKFPPVDKSTLLHHKIYFRHIQALANYFEVQKIFQEVKIDLRVKLGMFAGNNIAYSIDRERYRLFTQMLKPLLTSGSLQQKLQAVLPELPVFKFISSEHGKKEIVYSLDLRIESDRNLYIIASMMYLYHIRADENIMARFIKLFHLLLPPKTVFPRNFEELNMIFRVQGVELLVIAYRMEVLLHYFEKKAYPDREPKLNIDVIFGVDNLYGNQDKCKNEDKYKYTIDKEGEIGMPMEHVVHTASLFKFNPSPVSECNTCQEDSGSDEEDFSAGYKKPSWFNRSL